MARRDDALGVSGAETVIGSGVTVTGNLTSEGDMLIDGLLMGEIITTGDVTIGNNGVVQGNIKALNIVIAGSVTGNATAESETIIRETGQINGDITAAGLTIHTGGIFVGSSLSRVSPEAKVAKKV
jgi:cytoskeletal protein CcmA (bactofilin family)